MYALIILFIHILREPCGPTADSDLLLLGVGAAHFLRLEFASGSEISIPFAKDLNSLARLAMLRRKSTHLPPVLDGNTVCRERSGTVQSPQVTDLWANTAIEDDLFSGLRVCNSISYCNTAKSYDAGIGFELFRPRVRAVQYILARFRIHRSDVTRTVQSLTNWPVFQTLMTL